MVKVIFSDFDETMLDCHGDKNYFDQYQLDVLKKLKDNDIKFCIVTGRNIFFFWNFPEILPYVSYILSSNGSCIYDVADGKIIYEKYIKSSKVRWLLDYVSNNNYDLFYNSLGHQYDIVDDNRLEKCEQIILSFSSGHLENILEDIEKLTSVNYNNICRHGDRFTIDVNDSSVSKGNAISFLCKYLGIDKNDTIGFGDSDNDVSMFSVVGKAITVENASEKVKILADDITFASDDDGIFRYIDDQILK